jgi:hypothetical protein
MKVGMTVHEKEVKRYEARSTSPLEIKCGQEKRRERRAKLRK